MEAAESVDEEEVEVEVEEGEREWVDDNGDREDVRGGAEEVVKQNFWKQKKRWRESSGSGRRRGAKGRGWLA